jgi:hypothetical protein
MYEDDQLECAASSSSNPSTCRRVRLELLRDYKDGKGVEEVSTAQRPRVAGGGRHAAYRSTPSLPFAPDDLSEADGDLTPGVLAAPGVAGIPAAEGIGVEPELACERRAEPPLLEVVPPCGVEMRQKEMQEGYPQACPRFRGEALEVEEGLEKREHLRPGMRRRRLSRRQPARDWKGWQAGNLLEDRGDAEVRTRKLCQPATPGDLSCYGRNSQVEREVI